MGLRKIKKWLSSAIKFSNSLLTMIISIILIFCVSFFDQQHHYQRRGHNSFVVVGGTGRLRHCPQQVGFHQLLLLLFSALVDDSPHCYAHSFLLDYARFTPAGHLCSSHYYRHHFSLEHHLQKALLYFFLLHLHLCNLPAAHGVCRVYKQNFYQNRLK